MALRPTGYALLHYDDWQRRGCPVTADGGTVMTKESRNRKFSLRLVSEAVSHLRVRRPLLSGKPPLTQHLPDFMSPDL